MGERVAGSPGRTNPLAVASLVVAILWFGGLGSIAAVLLGSRAHQDISAGGRVEHGWGLASAGIALGWIGIIVSVVLFLAVCPFVASERRTSELDRQLESVEIELNITSALEDAARQERRYQESEGTYTTSHDVITEGGMYAGVTIEVVRADEDSFCIEASSSGSNRYWHIAEEDRKARPGRC